MMFACEERTRFVTEVVRAKPLEHLLERDSQTGSNSTIYLRPVSHKAVWLHLKVRTPVFEGAEHESELVFAS